MPLELGILKKLNPKIERYDPFDRPRSAVMNDNFTSLMSLSAKVEKSTMFNQTKKEKLNTFTIAELSEKKYDIPRVVRTSYDTKFMDIK
jgi:hypothetical protein